MADKEIKESINEMSVDELKTSCFEFAQDSVLLKEAAGLEIDEEISIDGLMNIFKKQGIEWIIGHIKEIKAKDDKFTIESFVEILSEYSKALGTNLEHTPKTLH